MWPVLLLSSSSVKSLGGRLPAGVQGCSGHLVLSWQPPSLWCLVLPQPPPRLPASQTTMRSQARANLLFFLCLERFQLSRVELKPNQITRNRNCSVLCFTIVGYQQNRVPHFHRKNYPPRQNYGPRPITAGLGLTLLKTKAKGQASEPPNAPPLRPTPLRLVRPS
jgi:hypothetical protein